jgi:hypothetical protein
MPRSGPSFRPCSTCGLDKVAAGAAWGGGRL